ncbi:MAG TPA: energy-coupling factor transporter transmembrane component T [Desulfomicrobiaceae bacterium]|nr:energy-coupling factor transporter transmembrane component T [Desulfomicrobiaceae bacterium]
MFPASLNRTSTHAGPVPRSRFSPGLLFGVCISLTILAVGARTLPLLLALTGLELLTALAAGVRLGSLRRELIYFTTQTTVITGLYCFQIGIPEGLWPGLRTSWQIALAFFPGLLLPRLVPQSEMTGILGKILPYRTAFVLAMSLRFLPMLGQEAREIYEAQVLRGARILPKDLLNPKNWPDLVHCLAVPLIIQGLKAADQVALAARAREFGRFEKRTYWGKG